MSVEARVTVSYFTSDIIKIYELVKSGFDCVYLHESPLSFKDMY